MPYTAGVIYLMNLNFDLQRPLAIFAVKYHVVITLLHYENWKRALQMAQYMAVQIRQ